MLFSKPILCYYLYRKEADRICVYIQKNIYIYRERERGREREGEREERMCKKIMS
jgi:hypothetical protein